MIVIFSVNTKADPIPDDAVAEINGTYYTSLTSAVNDVPNDTKTTIKLLKNIQESVNISNSKKIIVLDLNEHTLSNNGSSSVIISKGKLEIKNGTIISNAAKKGAVNIESGGTLTISDVNISHTLATNDGRQAIYNNGGTVYIKDDVILTSAAKQRATVHNLNNGTTTITGGTIIS